MFNTHAPGGCGGPHSGRGRGRGRGQHQRGGFGGHHQRGRRARRGQVRLAALLLIAEEPRNGYQIIQELEARTEGRWKPSPGAVYPALNQLEDEGLIRQSGESKVFEITEPGREAASEIEGRKPWEQDPAEADDTSKLHSAYAQIGTALGAIAETGDDALIDAAAQQLDDVRRSLYTLLADH